MNLLKNDNQSAWVLLSTALSKQLDYALSLQYPSDILEAAAAMDARLWAALEQVAGQSRIPWGEEGLGIECVVAVPGVPELQGRSFQWWVAAQPIKLGGCGLRSLAETSPVAFISVVEATIPHLVGVEGEEPICPQLEAVVGSVEGPQRWVDFLARGSRTALEFRQSWDSLTSSEARNIWRFLGKEPTGRGIVRSSGGGGGGQHHRQYEAQ